VHNVYGSTLPIPQLSYQSLIFPHEKNTHWLTDPREVVSDPEARYFGGRVEEHSLVLLGEARLGRVGLEEWIHRQPAGA
jgi:hypothetical protein